MIMDPCDNCRYFNHAKGVWETHPGHWVHAGASWIGVGFATPTVVDRGVQYFIDNFQPIVVGGGADEDEPETDYWGCEAIGVGGHHSDEYGDPGVCQWCGLRNVMCEDDE